MKYYLFFCFYLVKICVFGQNKDTSNLSISGYVDAYYSYFTDDVGANGLQQYTTVSPRSERFGLNIVQLGAHYDNDKIRGNLVLHAGDIAQATWSTEFRNVQMANFGIHFGKGWWLDAGFFHTHIGTESFLPKNNMTSSTAFATYNEPFYQAGGRLAYEGSDKFNFELWGTNGYNFFLDKNDDKSVGILFNYNLSDNTSITYTNLFGNEQPVGAPRKQFRTYHNLYLNTDFNEKVYLQVGGDFGSQTNSNLQNRAQDAFMYNALVTVRYQFHKQWSVTARGEIYDDQDGFISGTFVNRQGNDQGLTWLAGTLSGEYRPVENGYIRLEGRYGQVDPNTSIFSRDFSRTARIEAMVTMGWFFERGI